MNILNLTTSSNHSFYANQVSALKRQGISIDTLVVPGAHLEKENNVINRSIWDYARFLPKVLQKISTEYDLVHANFGNTAPFAMLQSKLPTVLTLWGSDLMGNKGFIGKICSHFVDEVIVPSKRMSEYLSCEHHIIPFGIDTNLFKPIRREKARERLGWNINEDIALFPYAKSRQEKNYELTQDIADTLNIKVKTISGEPYEKMPLFMNGSDFLIVTSDRESGPMVVKEAAACNVPIVSTDVGFVRSILPKVTNSFICNTRYDFIDRIEQILQTDRRSNGRIFADRWSLDAMAADIIEIYKKVIV